MITGDIRYMGIVKLYHINQYIVLVQYAILSIASKSNDKIIIFGYHDLLYVPKNNNKIIIFRDI